MSIRLIHGLVFIFFLSNAVCVNPIEIIFHFYAHIEMPVCFCYSLHFMLLLVTVFLPKKFYTKQYVRTASF